jgi:hypothetical protein
VLAWQALATATPPVCRMLLFAKQSVCRLLLASVAASALTPWSPMPLLPSQSCFSTVLSCRPDAMPAAPSALMLHDVSCSLVSVAHCLRALPKARAPLLPAGAILCCLPAQSVHLTRCACQSSYVHWALQQNTYHINAQRTHACSAQVQVCKPSTVWHCPC